MLSNLWYAHYAYDFENVLYVIESMVALTNASCSALSPSELILEVCCCFSNTQVQCIISKLNALPHPTACTNDKVYKNCGTSCPLTCGNYHDPPVCDTLCVKGCVCPSGMVVLEDGCAVISDCPSKTSHLAYPKFIL